MDTLHSKKYIYICFFPLMFNLFVFSFYVLPGLFKFVIPHNFPNSLQCLFCFLLCPKLIFIFAIAFFSYFSQHPL